MTKLISSVNQNSANSQIALNFSWDQYFNMGVWNIENTTKNNSNYKDIIWYKYNGAFINDNANIIIAADPIPLAGVTLKSYTIPSNIDLYFANSIVNVGNAIKFNMNNQEFLLIRESGKLSIVKRFDSTASIITNNNNTNTLDTLCFRNNSGAIKNINITMNPRSNNETTLQIYKTLNADKLELYIQPDVDGADFVVQTDTLVFTDFA